MMIRKLKMMMKIWRMGTWLCSQLNHGYSMMHDTLLDCVFFSCKFV